jgi:hypothetical protein
VLNAELHLVEFMDSLPLEGVDVTLVVRVAPIFEARVVVEPGEGDPPRPPGPPETEVQEVPDLTLAETVTLALVTGADGSAHFSADLSSAFEIARRKRKQGKQAVGATALIDAQVNFFGLILLSRRALAETGPDADIRRNIIVDPAKSIVGHTTADSALLWFEIHGAPAAAHTFTCEVIAEGGLPRTFPLTPNAQRANTAAVAVAGLTPGTRHRYNLRMRRAGDSEPGRIIARGAFRTAPAAGSAESQRLSIAFGSCHLPTNALATVNRWRVLAARNDYDLLFLIGDQIYGDGIEKIFPHDDWLQRYIKRYNQLWAYQPVRNVLRNTPVYMTLDDHEITDDWGVVSIPPDRLAAGLEAYRIFQQAHNPGGVDAPFIDYHFRRGPIAFYVMDSRTARGTDNRFPILGKAQFERIRQWSLSPEVRSADIIVFVAPVPIAVLPIQELQILADRLSEAAGAIAGALAGAAIGAIFGPGALIGAAIGAMVGALGAELAYEHLEDTVTEPDIRDAWTFENNLQDAVRVLDILFDLANDVDAAGQPGSRPRAVVMLSGDYHFGAIHRIRSGKEGNGHDHRTNNSLFQITSSPISHAPVNSSILEEVLQHVEDEPFNIDAGNYTAESLGRLVDRNFGRVVVEKSGPGRRYRMQFTVEAESRALVELLEFDLDARPVVVHDLVGDVLAARGKLTSLRVNELGSGFGPPTDFIDVEVVAEFDTEPGRGFGFQLRNDEHLAANRRMLALLRDAFNRDATVQIEYLRTGLRNGRIIRTTVFP